MVQLKLLLSQVIRIYVVLGLHFVQLFLLLVQVLSLKRLCRLIVEDNEIPIADVEAGQVVAGILCIENVLVHHKGCSSSLRSVATGNVPERELFQVALVAAVLFTYTLICRIAPYLPNMSYISSEVILYGKLRI